MTKNKIIQYIVWIAQGILVGFGAILPGVSGGALLAAFGMYKPVLDVISSPITGIKKHFWMLCFFVLGGGIGFVGLSGLVNLLLETNEAIAKCIFMGFMLGTIPELWSDAGKTLDKQKYPCHRPINWLATAVGFAAMLAILLLLNGTSAVQMETGLFAYLFCGICWGLSLILPGLSASTLLMFFGLYQPMLDGISRLSMTVCIPLGIGMLAVLLLLPRLVNAAFARWDAGLSHGILGIVVATTVMISPGLPTSLMGWLVYLLCLVGGAAVSFILGRICESLKVSAEAKNT